ncbi:hypothetical protein AUP68_12222 [Ilyonectria robusta]
MVSNSGFPGDPPLFIALRTSLLNAAQNDGQTLQLDAVLDLLAPDGPIDLSTRTFYGLTPLGMMTQFCKLDSMEILLSRGANPNQEFGLTHTTSKTYLPLSYLLEDGKNSETSRHSAFSLLLEHGASLWQPIDRLSTIENAIRRNDEGIISLIYTSKAGRKAIENPPSGESTTAADLVAAYEKQRSGKRTGCGREEKDKAIAHFQASLYYLVRDTAVNKQARDFSQASM